MSHLDSNGFVIGTRGYYTRKKDTTDIQVFANQYATNLEITHGQSMKPPQYTSASVFDPWDMSEELLDYVRIKLKIYA